MTKNIEIKRKTVKSKKSITSNVVGIPQLRLAKTSRIANKRNFDLEKKYIFKYEIKDQINQPHVVKFSGGRSSGMLLFTLLESDILKPERGDIVVFNNTSAEHPATYEFAAKCKKITEEQYGIPFFWTEFQTYEDASNGDWKRFPSYRLVNEKEYSEKNPNGYHSKGEVFEELLSWKKFVPTRFQRICTQEMKIFVTQEFLRDWFARKPGIERLGHWYESSLLNDETIIRLHKKHGGQTPPHILLDKIAYVRSRPHIRAEQLYSDYSNCIKDVTNKALDGKSFGDRTALAGDHAVDYVTFVGFRADEPARVKRMEARNYNGGECEYENDPHIKAPEGEYVYAPLAVDMGATKEDVSNFWRKQDWNLRLPDEGNLSNCVFCFLKGSRNIVNILSTEDKINKKLPKKLHPQKDTPGDIQWWVKMEKKYARDILKEGRKIINSEKAGEAPIIGFWGLGGKMSYELLAKNQTLPNATMTQIIQGDTALPCDCTD